MLDATPLLRLYANRRLAHLRTQRADQCQGRELQGLIQKAAHTRFGRDHDFAAIQSVKDFQARVPLRDYDDMRREYWQPDFPILDNCTWPGRMPFFATTSGTTTGVQKYIPCSKEMVRSNRRAALDLLSHHLANRPKSRIFGGKTFMLGSSTALVPEASGVYSGALSGIAAKTVPFWARSRFFPPQDLATLSDWEEKVSRVAEASIGENIRGFGGTPSWMLIFLDKLATLSPGVTKRSLAPYPDLELIVHGGVNFTPYRRQFDELCHGTRAELREVYPASEGFIAVQDRAPDEGLRLLLDSGLFYEFVPLEELNSPDPTRHWIGNAEIGVNYALVLSSCAGVWSYVLGDTVKLVQRDPPRILITGRTSYMLSAFGEHLIGAEIDSAVTAAADAIGAMISDYAVGSVMPEREGEVGGHLYIVEFLEADIAEARRETFGKTLDRGLADINANYKARRSDDFGLNAPIIHAVPPGSFAAWMKSRGKLGGQHKVPRIINDADLFQHLRDHTRSGAQQP
ncbi:MAG: auxin-regulated protein [Rhodospirillaceae bacterium]|nr:auxin-regulated protein [Rhodospirillaceae bacterium]MBT3928606.1 auxin-regulated protein [Rhodospirillaceae bacterium]MBT4426683.1 auxin-regulated protein [Rhodospirillaceae bacterium]MBT5038250.1 auxin-regulated protein [Rhodospirillaceae bacterium]MBT5675181.1 auxin-regulated protein [Rhodospirillaceae bacterium]